MIEQGIVRVLVVAIVMVVGAGGCGDKKSSSKDNATKEDESDRKSGDKKEEKSPGKSSGAPRFAQPAGPDGLKAVLAEMQKPDAKAEEVLAKLKPDAADYEATFDAETAKKVQKHVEELMGKTKELGLKPDAEIVIKASGTSEEFKEWKEGSPVVGHCPGGYENLGKSMKPGNTFYCVKVGSISLDVFAHVNGHWVWFPKAFRAVR